MSVCGANSTTYIYPAEVFPTKFRAAAHGMSAACGKAGAIVSALAFNQLSKKLGTPAVLWSEYYEFFFFSACFSLSFLYFALIPFSSSCRFFVFISFRMVKLTHAWFPVFFGCCIVGAALTQLLPESRGYDPDAVYAREIAEAQAAASASDARR